MLEAPFFLEEELKNGIDVDPTKLCLDWSLENAQVILRWCNGGRNQMWTVKDEYSTLGYHNLYNVDAALCLDDTDCITVNLNQCSPRKPQWWTVQCHYRHDCTGGIKYEDFVNPMWCLDAGLIKPLDQVMLLGCDETLQAQQWTMKWTGVKDISSGHYIFYLVMDPSSKKLKGLSPPEKPS